MTTTNNYEAMSRHQSQPSRHHHSHHHLHKSTILLTILLLINTTSSFILPIPPSTTSSSTTSVQLPSTSIRHCLLTLAADRTSGGAAPAADEPSSSSTPTPPQSFREAEILGLRLMQQGQHEDALIVFQEGLKLPGSRTDILRTKTYNKSPVGGSTGGSTGETVQILDEFEAQAAHYNIACAYANLGKSKEAVRSLENAFKAGFDNYATVRADPDLGAVQRTKEFEILMEQYDPKKGFPFSLFNGSKK